jgi:jumonji domain-containing protein 2
MGTAWPPGVDVAPEACRKPPITTAPSPPHSTMMSLEVIAPQSDCQHAAVDQLHLCPPSYAACPPVATTTAEAQTPVSHSPTDAELRKTQPLPDTEPLPVEVISDNKEPVSASPIASPSPVPNPLIEDQSTQSHDHVSPAIPKQRVDEQSSTSSSPLSTSASQAEEQASLETPPSQKQNSSPVTKMEAPQYQAKPEGPSSAEMEIEHDLDGPEGHPILRLKPTVEQWSDFPAVLSYARRLGAENDGCFKVIIPPDMLEPLPERSSQKAPANAYQIRQVKRNGFWKVSTVPSEGLFTCPDPPVESLEPVSVEVQKLKKMFNKNKDKQLRSVRYRVDIPAWTAKQRLLAGVPESSPIHPLKGDKLDLTKAIIPGIHTPYVYESAAFFGATFQIHAEDYRLSSLNHLYKGRKIWIVVPSTAVDTAEEALGRKKKCSQFMRHRAEFFFPDKLDKLGVPYRIVDQRPGETVVILPDAYHEGFSTGYTIAEAKNYAESDWTTQTYQACDEKCQLLTAIPAAYMKLLNDGEERLNLCARYGDDDVTHLSKRLHDDISQASDHGSGAKRIKV